MGIDDLQFSAGRRGGVVTFRWRWFLAAVISFLAVLLGGVGYVADHRYQSLDEASKAAVIVAQVKQDIAVQTAVQQQILNKLDKQDGKIDRIFDKVR